MGSPDIESSIHAPLSIEPRFGQVPEYVLESSLRQARHVLQEDGSSGFRVANDPEDGGPEPSRIVGLSALPRGRPGLAREARSDEIHDSTPASSVEGSQVRPDRARIQPSVTHARRQDGGRKGFDLHVTYGADSRAGGVESERDASDPGAKSQLIDGLLGAHGFSGGCSGKGQPLGGLHVPSAMKSWTQSWR